MSYFKHLSIISRGIYALSNVMTNVLFSVMQSQSPVVIGIGSGASGSKPDLETSLTESE